MKIALVQFYNYHEEVLSPQIDFLLPDNELFIFVPPAVIDNDYIKYYKNKIHQKILFDIKISGILAIPVKVISILIKYFQLYGSLKKEMYDMIIFNTINKPFHLFIIKILFTRIKKIHIIHNAQLYLTKKYTAKLGMFKKNLFISQDVYDFYLSKTDELSTASNFGWFCPSLSEQVISIPKNTKLLDDKINIVIPGTVTDSRRNYTGLFSALQNFKQEDMPFNIILLGKCGAQRQKEISDLGLSRMITVFSEYIPGHEMLYYSKHADIIAFLIDSTIGENFQYYNRYKASGTSVLCLTFGIPCLVSDGFVIDKALKSRTITYKDCNISSFFLDCISKKITKETLGKLKSLPIDPQYSRKNQKKHYCMEIGASYGNV
jgi:hypothetical protein